MKSRKTIFTIKEFKRVVVNEIRWSRRQSDMECIEMVGNAFIAVVDRPMTFIKDDEIEKTRREFLVNRHHAGVRRTKDAGSCVDLT